MKSLIFLVFLTATTLSWSRSISITQPIHGSNVPSTVSRVILKGIVDSVEGGAGQVVCNGSTANFTSGVNWIRAVQLSEAGANAISCTYTKDGSTASASIVVNWEGNLRPTSDFSSNTSGLIVDFDGTLSSDPDGTISNYQWDYGDGASGTGISTSHTYSQAGEYYVDLMVTDNEGAFKKKRRLISVTDIVKPDMVLSNIDPKTFNEIGSTLEFTLTSGSFDSDASNVLVLHNDNALPESEFQITASKLTIPNLLVEGLNDIQVNVIDSNGNQIEYLTKIWAGEGVLTVKVTDNGQPLQGALVKAQLADNKTFFMEGESDSGGKITFSNMPESTISIIAYQGNRHGTSVTHIEPSLEIEVKMIQLIPASTISNNDFTLGTDGWILSDPSAVSIVPHQENPTSMSISGKAINRSTDRKAKRYNFNQHKKSLHNLKSMLGTENDMQISTNDTMTPIKTTRSFKTTPGTSKIKLRYKFVTNEFPEYFGSKFNDMYSISLISTGTANQKNESESMNSLGEEAFFKVLVPDEEDGDYFYGMTQWRTLELEVNPLGDTVLLETMVRNVSDDDVDSYLVIDKIDESKLSIKSAELFDLGTVKEPLKYISLSPQNEYKGNRTLIKASLEIHGDFDDQLVNLELVIIQDGIEKAIGKLDTDGDTALRKELLSPFGTTKMKFLDFEQVFSISNSEAAKIDLSENGSVLLQVRATSKNGYTAISNVGPVIILTRYPYCCNDRRYGARTADDLKAGGDDWGQPYTIQIINQLHDLFGSTINFRVDDISNMNAGLTDHLTHRRGSHVDIRFSDYELFDITTAQRLLALMQAVGDDLIIVYIYTDKWEQVGNPFYEYLNSPSAVVGTKGKIASEFIDNVKTHDDHTHFQFKEFKLD